MIKVDVKGCSSFVKDEQYQAYVAKAFDAFDVLKNESGAGNDFLGWKKLPRQITEREIHNYEAIRDKWMKSSHWRSWPRCPRRGTQSGCR